MSHLLSSSDLKRPPLSSSTSSLHHLKSRSRTSSVAGSDAGGGGEDEFFTIPPALKYSRLEDSSSVSVRLASPFHSAGSPDFELIQARAKIAQLEGKITSLNRFLAEERTQHDSKKDDRSLEQQKLEARISVLERELAYMTEKEQLARDTVTRIQEASDHSATQMKQKCTKVLDEKKTLQSEWVEFESSTNNRLRHLRSELTSAQTKCNELQFQLSRAQTELKAEHSRCEALEHQLKQYIENYSAANQKARNLDMQMKQFQEEAKVALSLRNDLNELQHMRKENERLKKEWQRYKNLSQNTLLLTEEKLSLSTELKHVKEQRDLLAAETAELKQIVTNQNAETSYDAFDHLSRQCATAIENERLLRTQMDTLQMEITNTSAQFDAEKSNLTQRSCDMELTIAEKEKDYAEIENALKELQIEFGEKDAEFRELKKYLATKEAEIDRLNLLTQNLEEEKNLIEINLKKIFEEEKNSIEMNLKNILEQKEKEIFEMKNERNSLGNELKQKTEIINEMNEKIRAQEILEKELKEKNELIDGLKNRLNMKGDFDPTVTKVLHMEFNPLETAHKNFKEELQQLKEENQRLHLRVEVLETSGQTFAGTSVCQISSPPDLNVTQLVAEKLSELQLKQEIQNLQQKMVEVERQALKRQEISSQMAKNFRKVTLYLTGYNIKLTDQSSQTQTYKVQSVYEPDEERCFCFKRQQNSGELQLIEDQYMNEWADFVESYLLTDRSVPAFLSAVTLQLYKREESSTSASAASGSAFIS